MWTFNCYTTLRGKNEIKDWYESLSPEDQAKIYTKLELLKNSNKNLWKSPLAKKQSGKGKCLYEIRFLLKGNNQYRVIGYFVDEKKEFVMTNYFQKKSDSDNKRGFKKGEVRKGEIEKNEKLKKFYDFSAG
jgi:phage-related protein